MLAAAGMLRRRQEQCGLPIGNSEAIESPTPPCLLVLPLGVGVGLLTGVVGVGGGFLIVPALTLLARVPVKRAASMSLWIIAANSAAGLVGYLGHVPMAWGAAGLFLAFALFLVVVGCFTIFKIQTIHKPIALSTVAVPRTDRNK